MITINSVGYNSNGSDFRPEILSPLGVDCREDSDKLLVDSLAMTNYGQPQTVLRGRGLIQ